MKYSYKLDCIQGVGKVKIGKVWMVRTIRASKVQTDM